jgi:hypothetical protein
MDEYMGISHESKKNLGAASKILSSPETRIEDLEYLRERMKQGKQKQKLDTLNQLSSMVDSIGDALTNLKDRVEQDGDSETSSQFEFVKKRLEQCRENIQNKRSSLIKSPTKVERKQEIEQSKVSHHRKQEHRSREDYPPRKLGRTTFCESPRIDKWQKNVKKRTVGDCALSEENAHLRKKIHFRVGMFGRTKEKQQYFLNLGFRGYCVETAQQEDEPVDCYKLVEYISRIERVTQILDIQNVYSTTERPPKRRKLDLAIVWIDRPAEVTEEKLNVWKNFISSRYGKTSIHLCFPFDKKTIDDRHLSREWKKRIESGIVFDIFSDNERVDSLLQKYKVMS